MTDRDFRILQPTASRAVRYLEKLPHRHVAPTLEALNALRKLDEPLPLRGAGDAAAIALLDELGAPATVATAGPRYFGFILGGSFPVAIAANWLATAWDQCAGARAMSPLAAQIEDTTARWLLELLRLPSGAAVGFATGSTSAHISLLLAARRHILAKLNWDVEARGLVGAPPLKVVVTDEVHASVLKALGIIGLGREEVVRVPVDAEGRIDLANMPDLNPRTILICQAGNVNTGSFDDIEALADLAERSDAWLHVDGAFGTLARVSPALEHLVVGLERADSLAFSAHKLLNVPYDSAIAICRHSDVLEKALSIETSYTISSGSREPNHFTIEGSRRARAIDIWAVLKALGRDGLSNLVERCHNNAESFASILKRGGVPVLNQVNFNQVVFDLGPVSVRNARLQAVQADGTCWLGPTNWQGRSLCRASFVNWSTSPEDVQRSADAVLRAASRI